MNRLSRRNFLLAAGAGALTAAAVVAKNPAAAPSHLQHRDKRATRGYQASEHVNQYYRTAKV